MTTYGVIMAGGSGTRFWPASRRLRPKQLLALVGDDTLLAQSVARVSTLCDGGVFIATGAHLAEASLAAVPSLPPERLLVEPVARNTAPCLGWAAARVAREDEDAVVIALPADPHIEDEAGFLAALQLAVERAANGVITTIGVTPTRPETGYGYIEAEPGDAPVRQVKRFVEKPDAATAQRFLEAGSFFWNAGIFVFRAKDMMAAIAEHLPELARGLERIDAGAAEGREDETVAEVFPTLPAVSIDNGVMEHVSEMAVVPAAFGWSDLGSWLAVAELADTDDEDNAAPEGAILVSAKNNHVVDRRRAGGKRVIALVGVDDLVVVETDDALLVMKRDEAQRVREVVAALEARGDSDLV